MNREHVTDWLIFIGGFMQNRELAIYGMCGMAKEALQRYQKRGVYVDFEPWNTDWNATAEWIFRWSGGSQPNIMVVSYSWGSGWGFLELAEYLSRRQIFINVAVANDAVRHVGGWWGHYCGLSQVCAYLPFWRLEKPSNVQRFEWFVQGRNRAWRRDWNRRETWLRGHKWFEENGTECPARHLVPLATHRNMDDSRDFRKRVFELADELFLQRVA